MLKERIRVFLKIRIRCCNYKKYVISRRVYSTLSKTVIYTIPLR